MKKAIFILLFGIISPATFAQFEILFNFQNPTLFNPASVGGDSAMNVFSVYQNNSSDYGYQYHLEKAGFTAPVPKLHGGVGIMASREWSSSFNGSITNLTGIYSYHKKTKSNLSFSFALMPELRINDFDDYSFEKRCQFNVSLAADLRWKKFTFGASGYNIINRNFPGNGFKLFAAYNQFQPGKVTDDKIHFSPMLSFITNGGDVYLVASGSLRYKFMQVGADISSLIYLKSRPEFFFHAGVNFENFSLLYRYCPNWYQTTINEISLGYRFGKK